MDLSAENILVEPLDLDRKRGMHSDGGIKLFGVTLRKIASTGNLNYNSQSNQQFYEYVSDGFLHNPSKTPLKKRAISWTEEEHRLFLTGLVKLGKGDWRGISRGFVITRTPTQVASHAQKYYLRQRHVNIMKHRSSLFHICPHDNYNSHKAGNIEPKRLNTGKDLSRKSTFRGTEEKGCGLSLSIAPPSLDSFPFSQFYGK